MNACMRLLAAAAATLVLASCATTDDRATLAPAYDGQKVNHAEYMAVVEGMATRRGVRVVWVNPPKVDAPRADTPRE